MGTPMHPNTKLEKDDGGKDMDETRYRGMIGSLMYLTSSRPDIVQSVGICSRFQSHPKESHLSAIKHIIRYVKGTCDYGLWYPKSDDFCAVGFCDADYAGDIVDRRRMDEIKNKSVGRAVIKGEAAQNLILMGPTKSL
ncbi:secreted RxLR effector protein 161-like [Arachis stenosperma]|uniref:secreted RxLR effector protein 161-like n=1 Tax=Arachis stenosperma TaxID=217475 RepID=UPI0025AD97A1|nr:secreted RxLR effector protein 161-like [Arachis stenosperma]